VFRITVCYQDHGVLKQTRLRASACRVATCKDRDQDKVVEVKTRLQNGV
jgi:hypothetical protein